MIHKISIVGALLSILYVVYTSMYKGYVFTPMLLLLALFAALYYVTTSIVTRKMVNKKEGKNISSFKGGLVDKNDLIPGRLAFDKEKIVFYKRKGDLGGVSECFSLPISELESYSIGKINEYHSGIRLVAKGEREFSIKCKQILKAESLFTSEIGWNVTE